MNAWRRVARAPGLIALIAVLQLALAAWLGSGVRAAVGASLGPFSLLSEGHLLFAVVELFSSHPGILASYRTALIGSSVFALLLWTVLAPAIILRLRAANPPARIAATALRGLPAVVVTTLWCLLPRGLLLAAAGFATARLMPMGHWGLAGLAVTFIVLAYTTCALDLARCGVMLRGARRFHVATAIGAYREAWRRPSVLLPSMLLSLARWGCVAAMLALAIDQAGAPWTIWTVRSLAIVNVVLGVGRVAVAVEASS